MRHIIEIETAAMPNFTPGPWIVEDEEIGEYGEYTEPQVFS